MMLKCVCLNVCEHSLSTYEDEFKGYMELPMWYCSMQCQKGAGSTGSHSTSCVCGKFDSSGLRHKMKNFLADSRVILTHMGLLSEHMHLHG